MMLAAASMNLGSVWVSVRDEVQPELRQLFRVPEPLRLLWIVPIGHARSWPKAKPRRKVPSFTHTEIYNPKKIRQDSEIRAWPKS
jgi:nitroreductase